MKVYDAKGIVLGRLASHAAKDALLGEDVVIVNCEQAVISGARRLLFLTQKRRREKRGYPLAGVRIHRSADRFVRRSVRGMVPWTKTRGREAFKRVMCHIGIPKEVEGKEMISLTKESVSKFPNSIYVTVAQLMKDLGGKQ
ncbi:50S ribosomal protein L13 [archaeon]|jgi:large subunit ribosomal protein L13|nr:50S ribosomal protein L13 [archaeon]MBT6761598.1 50S ribosomal protein L13 [archaeon]